MDIKQISYFLAVAREKSFSKAAENLTVSQPTLSVAVKKLEEELGVKLFRRGQYRVVLTDEGMLLRRRAQEILELAEKPTSRRWRAFRSWITIRKAPSL